RVPGGRPGCDQLHVAAPVDPRVLHVHRAVVVVDRRHDRQPGVQQLLLVGPLEDQPEGVGVHDGVEVSAVREVVSNRAQAGNVHAGVQRVAVGDDVADRYVVGDTVGDTHLGDHQPCGGVQ